MSFKTLATIDAQIKRAPLTGGKRGALALHLSGLKATPLYPANPELAQRLQLATPYLAKETFIVGQHDIQTGDVLAMEGKDYTIRGVAAWRSPGQRIGRFMHLVVEDVQL
jgi:hypothetical protein